EVTDANGNLRDAGDVLQDMADPLRDLESDSERAAITTALLGRSSARMGILLSEGTDGIKALREEFHALGGGMSEESIKAAADYTDAIARMDLAMLGVKSRISLFLLPSLQRLAEGTARVIGAFS